jgi:hypothetical protein
MGTTLVIVELLIVGFQVMVLLAPVFWALFHVALGLPEDAAALKKWLAAWPNIKDWMPLLTIPMLGAAYTLGLVFDRLYGLLGQMLGARQMRNRPAEQSRSPSADDISRLMLAHPDLISRIERPLFHIRLLRATCFNCLIGAFLILPTLGLRPWRVSVGLLLLCLLSAVAWWYAKHDQDEGNRKFCACMNHPQ